MNYKKIYNDFIDNRKSKKINGYYEVHHIIPRSFGGNNNESNLIKLTSADHFFAHILLAKIYGKSMIPAVFLMSNRRWDGKPKKEYRLSYEIMRKEWARYAATMPGKKGNENGNYNHDRFEWLNLDTLETLHATMNEMHSNFGGTRGMWTQVVSGAKNSAYGWIVNTGVEKKRGLKNKKTKFINEDGRFFIGTQKDFIEFSGVSTATASRICRHGSISICGWKIEGSEKPSPPRKNKGGFYKLVNNENEVKILKRLDAALFLESSASQFSAGAYGSEKNKKPYKGWYVTKTN
jgi:hypothetical protein